MDQGDRTSLWQADDETLGRRVSVRVLAPGHPRLDDLVDAARRAAGVEDPRLVRVLDVGTEPHGSEHAQTAYVVSEWVASRSLADRLENGALDPAEARHITGEAALALERARHRGLHHLRLTPRSVLVDQEHGVKVTGLAVDAAVAGIDEADPAEASRWDAECLVALLYAALTAHWPLGPGAGVPAAPRLGSHVVTPSEIASGIPADLETLCAQTFVGGRGPASPAEVAQQLAPWHPPAPRRESPTPRGERTSTHRRGEDPSPLRPAGTPTLRPALAPPPPPGPVAPLTGELPAPTAAPGASTQPMPRVPITMTPETTAPQPVVPPAEEQPAVRPALPTPPLPEESREAEPPAQPEDPGEATQAMTAAEPAPSAAAGDPITTGSLRALTPGPVLPLLGTDDGEDEEPPAPWLPATGTERPPRDQARVVFVIVGIFVALVLLLGYCGLRGLGQSGQASPATRSSTSSKASSPSSSGTSSSPANRPSSSAPAAGPIQVASATGFDPQGDGSEKNAQAGRAVDGNDSTAWTSDRYNSASFGGLKDGVGLLLDLGRPTAVHQAQVVLGAGGGSLELRAASGDSLTGSKVLATADNASGTVTLKAPAAVTTRYVIVWFTQAAPSDGGYRAEVSEVTLR